MENTKSAPAVKKAEVAKAPVKPAPVKVAPISAKHATPVKPKVIAVPKLAVKIPSLQTFLKSGTQFGHQARKWNPKMNKYIFAKRGDIHIIDLSKTLSMLEKAMSFLVEASLKGNVLFVGTKRQSRDIIKTAAIDSNSFYIVNRWPGGMFTNFKLIQKSLKAFNTLEEEFESGVEDRTKFEVSQMKKDWVKMNRLYEGVKSMKRLPTAVVVVDSRYEYGAVKEARKAGVPVVSLVDTNSDPDLVDYAIPANDDAVKSVTLIVDLLAQAVKQGQTGKGIEHNYKDYSKFEVKLIKREEQDTAAVEIESPGALPSARKVRVAKVQPVTTAKKSSNSSKGMLEKMQDDAETQKIKKAKATRNTK